MAKLIDIEKIKPMDFPSTEMDGLDVVRYLNALPTVDAVEVVHGHWIEFLTRQNTSGYECSICKRTVTVVSDVDLREKVLTKKYPYCNCGAKMDGVSDG